MPVNDEILGIKDTILGCVDCSKIFLFGSYAYGEPNADSDYDFYVVLNDDSELKPIIAMQTIYKSFLTLDTLMPIDVLADYKSSFEDRSKLPTIERKIVREGILLYERS